MQGGKEKVPIIKAIADAGVPVMSHVGMCPHFVHQYGGFKLQGRTAAEAMRIVEDGIAIEEAGAVGFEIEAVPAPVAKAVDDAVKIFTFAIGAGPASCGQLLLAFDLLGVFDQFPPKFTKRYAQISDVAVDAPAATARGPRGSFPMPSPYGMKPEGRTRKLLSQRKRCGAPKCKSSLQSCRAARVAGRSSSSGRHPAPHEVVRAAASGICQTDVHARDGYFPLPWPAVYGHEGGASSARRVGNWPPPATT
jgi:hypothetical protein